MDKNIRQTMNPLIVRIAAAALAGSALVGCGSFSFDATSLTGPAAEKTRDADAKTDPVGHNLPTDLDGEIRRAQLLRSQGDFEGATHSLSQLMLVAPDDPRVVGEYGKVLAQEGRPREALDFLNRAIQLQPNDWMLYSALGVSYDQINDQNSARVAYEAALRLKPGDASVLNNYAMSRMLAGDLPAARQLMAQAASAGSADPKIDRNQEMIEKLAAKQLQSAPVAMPDASPKPVTQHMAVAPKLLASAPRPLASSVASPKPADGRVVMQDVPFDPLAGPVGRATHAPRKLVAAPRPLVASTVAQKPADPRVVMQEVPFDPLAGPVGRAAHASHKLAAAPKPHPAHAAKSKIPALRKMADADKP
jgi:Flp pilus assembly protein TadD